MAFESAVSRYRLTSPAQADVAGILEYLLEKAGPNIASRYERDFTFAFRSLAATPGLGHVRADLAAEEYLFFQVQPYFIIYKQELSQITIHAVVHGARDLKSLMPHRS